MCGTVHMGGHVGPPPISHPPRPLPAAPPHEHVPTRLPLRSPRHVRTIRKNSYEGVRETSVYMCGITYDHSEGIAKAFKEVVRRIGQPGKSRATSPTLCPPKAVGGLGGVRSTLSPGVHILVYP